MRLPSILIILALTGFIGAAEAGPHRRPPPPPRPPASAPATARPAVHFHEAGYRYCDAVLLSQLWATDTRQAKTRASQKLQTGHRPTLDAALERAREDARAERSPGCSFVDTGFTYADAEDLAAAWKIGVSEAKAQIRSKAHWGQWEDIERILAEARRRNPDPVPPNPDEQALSAFFESSQVDSCHAKMLAAAWGSSIHEAKVILGHKIRNQDWELLSRTLMEARQHARSHPAARCAVDELPYSEADAQALARYWRVDLPTARKRMVQAYLEGSEPRLRSDLAAALGQ